MIVRKYFDAKTSSIPYVSEGITNITNVKNSETYEIT